MAAGEGGDAVIAVANHAQVSPGLLVVMILFVAGIATLAVWYGRTR
jgi:hypothetical protein